MDTNQFLDKIQYKFNAKDQALIARAFELATLAHAGQKRFSGADYIEHPIQAALLLAEIFPNATTIAATLLHDVPEDSSTSLDQVRKEFGAEVAQLVDGVTKLGKVRLRNSTENIYIENLRKMFVATSKDIRVIIIKLADRLHNMRTIEFVPAAKRQRIAKETLEIFAPLANRLGIGEWKDELEDLSFKIVDPDAYAKTKEILDTVLAGRKNALQRIQKDLATLLKMEGVKFDAIQGRIKRVYSLYKKLRKYAGEAANVHDWVALRIITKSSADCYAALGAIHQHFQPLDKIKDYIAQPKPNGYRSLHTTVFDAEHNIFEIQIRTGQMHDQAERGVAAHWVYDESGKTGTVTGMNVSWVKDLRQAMPLLQNPREFLDTLKIDFFQNRIFALTPKGDVKDLPENATPIDFAFSVHTDLASYMLGAKVNGKMVKIDHGLANGDVVEIIKSKKPVKISRDWLNHAKTSHARARIRRYLEERGISAVAPKKSQMKKPPKLS